MWGRALNMKAIVWDSFGGCFDRIAGTHSQNGKTANNVNKAASSSCSSPLFSSAVLFYLHRPQSVTVFLPFDAVAPLPITSRVSFPLVAKQTRKKQPTGPAEMSSAQMTMDVVDPVDPHRQLHQTLYQSTAACEPTQRYYTRKHSRTSSYDTVESGWSSDESGRFDDADEFAYNPSRGAGSPATTTHSTKRRRSNDWPNTQHEDKGSVSSRNHHSHSIWPFHHGRSSRPASPRRSPAAGKHGRGGSLGKSCGRRSRFVEENMNDSVSEKPPSIFFREESSCDKNAPGAAASGDGPAPSQRNSGIFRFGKAIASAFSPFGVWNNVSDIWRNTPEGAGNVNGNGAGNGKPPPAPNDALAQAEKAYAELKKAGYKGTVKGSYMQQQQQHENMQGNSNQIPDETWKAIMEKMNYKPTTTTTATTATSTGRHSRQSSGEGGSSIRSSFQDLRKAKSSLGISSISLLSNSNRRSEESDGAEVRRQKSRKELQKQAKLMKRVSNLEEKLERARRELQVLMGTDEPEPGPDSQTVETSTLCQEKPYSRKFVPGALPSLPSERLLQEEEEKPVPEEKPTPLRSMSENVQRTPVEDKAKGSERRRPTGKRPAVSKSPKQLTEDQTPGLAIDSPSRKRKSPEPASLPAVDVTETDSSEQKPSHGKDEVNENQVADSDGDGASRMLKLPKAAQGDSPGSVERRQSRERPATPENDGRSPSERERRGRRQTPPPSSRRSVSRRSPSSRKRSSNSRNVTPCLRMKKGRNNLRSASMSKEHSHNEDPDKENQEVDLSPRKVPLHGHEEEQRQTDAEPSPSPSPSKRKHNYSYIPPVPPLPKDLAATAARVDRRLAKELERRRSQQSSSPKKSPQKAQKNDEQYKWPEDIF